ncbi:MAG: endonuclease/exonuclease/phosphatase family protein [Chloroflexi bacterium]|nr:endonuclease/exonuclease/phosphatase family protein [Chloroflexota bacterium]
MTTPLTVMTWNVENLFPPGYPISPSRQVTAEAFDAKLMYLTEQIRAVQPDVVALQELGGASDADDSAFMALAGRLADILPQPALSAHPDSRPTGGGIRVGFLSRLPILATAEVVDFAPGELAAVPGFGSAQPSRRLSRGALCIEVEPAPGLRVHLISAHLKSKLITYPPAPGGHQARFDTNDEDERARGTGLALLRRTAEAVALRVHVNAVLQAADAPQVVLLGDLNDEPLAATTQLLLGPADSDVTSPDRRDGVRLYNLCDTIPLKGSRPTDVKEFLAPDRRYSRLYEGRGELIDHILVSRGLLGTPEQNRQGQWAVTEVTSLVESIQGESVGNNPTTRVDESHPDHAPIVARFAL